MITRPLSEEFENKEIFPVNPYLIYSSPLELNINNDANLATLAECSYLAQDYEQTVIHYRKIMKLMEPYLNLRIELEKAFVLLKKLDILVALSVLYVMVGNKKVHFEIDYHHASTCLKKAKKILNEIAKSGEYICDVNPSYTSVIKNIENNLDRLQNNILSLLINQSSDADLKEHITKEFMSSIDKVSSESARNNQPLDSNLTKNIIEQFTFFNIFSHQHKLPANKNTVPTRTAQSEIENKNNSLHARRTNQSKVENDYPNQNGNTFRKKF